MTPTNAFARLIGVALVATASASAVLAQAQPATSTPPAAQAQPMAQTADSAITAGVKAALLSDKRVATLQIDVSTTDGVVVLKGSVPSADAAQQAAQVAASVAGVKDIRNELKVAG